MTICIKPAGVVSEDGGMPELLSAQQGGRHFCVHRLDKAVGGVMVYARSSRAAAALSRLNEQREMEKHYLALAPDVFDDEGVLKDLLFRDREKNKSYVVKRMRRGVKEASLEYRKLCTIDGTALLKIRLHTGRSHQIRCQLSSRKAPILGDRKYGSGESLENLALWSCSLAFIHPFTGERLRFSALPEGDIWTDFLAAANLQS